MNSQNTECKQQPQVHIKKSILFTNNNLTYIQLGQLQKSIAEIIQQNKKKYNKIVELKPDFNYQLYKIGEFQANSRAFGKELLLRQLDRLLEQKNYLDRELSLIRFENEEQTDQKEKMICDETNHFQLLKSIWKKDRTNKYEGSLQHVEQLNIMVAQIKSNIHSLIKFQANQRKQFQQVYLNTFQVLHDKNKECRKCGQLKAKNDSLLQKLEKIEQKLSKISDQNIEYLEQINKREDKIKKMTKTQLKQQAQLKDKLLRLEQQMLKRDQAIKHLKKEIVDLEYNKMVNEKEGFQIFLKGIQIDFNKIQRKINVSGDQIIRFFTQQIVNDFRIVNQEGKRQSVKSKCDSTEDSAKSIKEMNSKELISATVAPEIYQKMNNQTEKVETKSIQKRKIFEQSQLKQKLEELEVGHKRYVRTGSKRANRSSSNIQNDESQKGLSLKVRGASPNFIPNLE